MSFDFHNPASQQECQVKMQQCMDKELDDVQQVTVNDHKTDVIYIASSYYQDQITINKLTCRPKKRSADKFDSSDPSYCQFLIKL